MINAYISRTTVNQQYFYEMLNTTKKWLSDLLNISYHPHGEPYIQTKTEKFDPAEILFVYLPNDESSWIGKGMYTEIMEFIDKKGPDNIFLISRYDSGNFIIRSMHEIEFIEINDNWSNYAQIYFDNNYNVFEYNDKEVLGDANFRKHLLEMIYNKSDNKLLIKCL
jgi:hypothetical protein